MEPVPLQSFARERVFPSIEERSRRGGFDRSLWSEMASMGLLGMIVDGEYGGGGRGAAEFARLLAVLASEGCDLGLALSIADHAVLGAYALQAFGSLELRRRFLPSLCGGERIGAAAVSEPESGGDPTRMKTRAVREKGEYVLVGTKEPITNGPVADLFVVVASTDPEAGKDGLSAFVVERKDGVRVEEMETGFLPTAPHGRVILDGARVPAGNLLGEEGWGHERISRSLFVWERAVIVPVIVAFMERWHHLVVSGLDPSCCSPDDRVLLARRKVELTAYRVLAERLLGLAFDTRNGGRERMELLLFFGKALPEWVESMRAEVEGARIAMDETAAGMLRDLRLLEVGSSLLDWRFQKLLF